MRRRAAPRSPDVADRGHLFHGWPRLKTEGDFDGFLNRQISGGPCVAVTEAKQQIDVGRPRSDAVQGGQYPVGIVGGCFRERREIQPSFGDFAGDEFQGLDLGSGESQPAESVGARPPDQVVVKGIERRGDARPYRRRGEGRELLTADGRCQSGKPRFAPSQGRHARQCDQRLQSRVPLGKRGECTVEIGLGMEMLRHRKLPA